MARDKQTMGRRASVRHGQSGSNRLGAQIGNWLMGGVRTLWAWSWLFSIPVALYLTVALYSYSPHDASFSVSTADPVNNWAGPYGALVADSMLLAFGRSAWWFVLGLAMIAFFAIRSMVRRVHGETDPLRINPPKLTAAVGFLALLIGSTCLEALRLRRFRAVLPGEAGGILGDNLAFGLYHYVGLGMATVLFFTLIVIGLSLLMDFEWQDVAEKVGEFIDRWIFKRVRALREHKETKRLQSEAGEANEAAFRTSAMKAQEEPLKIMKTEGVPEEDSEEDISAFDRRDDEEPDLLAQLRQVAPANRPLEGNSTANIERMPSRPAPSSAGRTEPSMATRTTANVKPKAAPHLSLSLLDDPQNGPKEHDSEALALMSRLIVSKLKSYNIEASVRGAQTGPVITQYWLEPGPGVKGSQIENIAEDLKRALGVQAVRVVPSIPNTTYIGLEVPNPTREMVRLKELLSSELYRGSKAPLTLALGKDIAGKPFVIDLAKMPHLLVAGTTGSGKSVGINAMILSMLYRNDPSDLRLVLIDPKMLEFSPYNGIPHLLCPVVTDMDKAAMALKWLTREMDRRYEVMSRMSVRHFTTYNEKVREAAARGESIPDPTVDPSVDEAATLEVWPYIVCIIDELADLMLTNRKEVEGEITRLAQKARAAGIHLVIATQRPSVDVVTSLIKANVPTRISFQVASSIDSRVILGETGAESLLGSGDMLLRRPGLSQAVRIQGCFVPDDEVTRVVEELQKYGEPDYVEGVTEEPYSDDVSAGDSSGRRAGESDPLYDKAVDVVLTERRASISFVQRHLGIGYNRAANILEAMENAGIVSKASPTGKRDILVPTRD